jgi:phosphotransacetylase
MESGVATRPLADLEAYRQRMARFMYQSGASMEPVFAAAKIARKLVAFAEGEDDRVLRSAQVIIDEGLATPVLVGRADVIAKRVQSLGLRLNPGSDCEVVNFESDSRYEGAWREYYQLVRRELTLLAAEAVRRFGLTPSVALLSHSSFGSTDSPSAQKMRDALALIQRMAPDLAVEGEMHGDAALSKRILDRVFPDSNLKSEANLLIMPNLDAGNIAYNLLRVGAGGGITVGPILLGAAKPAHILTQTATVRGILNMTALAAVDAGHTGVHAMTRIAAE